MNNKGRGVGGRRGPSSLGARGKGPPQAIFLTLILNNSGNTSDAF
jgi:hypothetical protein